jgi:hypothetical protein
VLAIEHLHARGYWQPLTLADGQGGTGGGAPDRKGLGKGDQPPVRADDGAERGRTGSPSRIVHAPGPWVRFSGTPITHQPAEPASIAAEGEA